jgi:hypothetical protein
MYALLKFGSKMAGNQELRLTSTGAFLKQSDAPDFCSGLLCFENMPKREFFVAPVCGIL